MYACMYVCMYVCMHACIYTYVHIHSYTNNYVRMTRKSLYSSWRARRPRHGIFATCSKALTFARMNPERRVQGFEGFIFAQRQLKQATPRLRNLCSVSANDCKDSVVVAFHRNKYLLLAQWPLPCPSPCTSPFWLQRRWYSTPNGGRRKTRPNKYCR